MNFDNCKRGNLLSPEDQRHVLAAYIYRTTVENKRLHPEAVRTAGGKLPPISDKRWLEITDFAVTASGALDHRTKYCFTNHNEVPEWRAIIQADWTPDTKLDALTIA